MNRSLRICRKPGCTILVKDGYCNKHRYVLQENQRNSWSELDKRKTDEAKKFYSSSRWTQCSIIHRVREPLCRRCKKKGIIKVAEMVHHNPSREILVARELNPFDDQWLESLCFDCHQEELRKKRVVASN